MTLFQSILLGIVQGLTEFLPVSSSAHLVLVPHLLGWKIPAQEAFIFDVLVQVATLVAQGKGILAADERVDYPARPVDTYFFERYQQKYPAPPLADFHAAILGRSADPAPSSRPGATPRSRRTAASRR